MRRLASYALLAAVALAAAGCGASKKTVVINDLGSVSGSRIAEKVPKGVRVGPGPFVLNGGSTTGGESGLMGDGGDGAHGTSIGCLNGRRYTDAFGIQNSTKAPIRLTGAGGANPSPRIVGRFVIQLRLSPPYHPSEAAPGDLVYRHWSAGATKPVTIPPGRIATVQRDFLLRNCHELGRPAAIPGSLVLRYLQAGRAHRQTLTIPGSRLLVVRGPTKHTCTPVSGSGSLVAADVSCAFARHAAPFCRPMQNEGWLGCTVAGRFWECGRFAGPGYPLLETCYLPHEKSHWFSVVWIGHGLGIWGAIANRRWNLGWNRIDASQTTKGICEDRPAGSPFVFESSALRISRGRAIARVAADARVRFVLRDFRGPGRFSARATVEVAVGPSGTKASYVATAGRLTVTRVTGRSASGTVYASLRQANGMNRASLNGTWSCRTTVG